MHAIRQTKPTVTPTIRPTLDLGSAGDRKKKNNELSYKSLYNALAISIQKDRLDYEQFLSILSRAKPAALRTLLSVIQ